MLDEVGFGAIWLAVVVEHELVARERDGDGCVLARRECHTLERQQTLPRPTIARCDHGGDTNHTMTAFVSLVRMDRAQPGGTRQKHGLEIGIMGGCGREIKVDTGYGQCDHTLLLG